MGLDSYVYLAHKEAIKDKVDFTVDYSKYNVKELFYFRKNSALHSFMKNQYFNKGGTDIDFNCSNVELTLDDLNYLQDILNSEDGLPPESGFFWGSMDSQKYEDIQIMINTAKDLLAVTPDYVLFYNGNY